MTSTDQSTLSGLRVQSEGSRLWVGWLLGIFTTIGFSLATPISRNIILQGTSPSNLLILRLGMASLLMGGTWAIYKPTSLRFDRRSMLWVWGLGALSGISTLCYNWALTRVDASMAVMIYAINPVVALSFLWLGGERMTQRQIVRLGLALGGVYLLIGPGGNVSLWGVLLLFGSMLTWSAQMVGVQWYLRDKDSGAISFYIATSSFVVVVGYWLMQGHEFQSPSLQSWLLIVVQVVVATYLARLCFFTAIQKIGSGQMALLLPVETVLAVIWSIIFLHERIAWQQALGGLLILTSAILAFERLGRLRVPGRWKAILPIK
ncbi:MAG: DMT family transporter [Caldilineaceae bacterium]